MPSFDSLSSHQTELLRKTIGGSVFVAPATAPLITSLTETTGTSPNEVISLMTLPPGYEDLGYLTDDGAQFSTDSSTSDTTSWQSTQPTRSDMVSRTSTLQVAAQETKLLTIGLYTGADPAGIVPDVDTSEVNIAMPERPSGRFYRVLALGVDETEFGEIYVARYLPRAKVTAVAEQSMSKGDTTFNWGVTFTGYKDTVAGTAERFIFGGPGWAALSSEMGF